MPTPLYVILILASWISFFVIQVLVIDEKLVTVAAIIFSALLFIRRERGEGAIYLIGVVMGLIIEVGLGQVARTQFFTNASLFGVPLWLPLAWGYGFVVIRRVGNGIVEIVQG